MTKTYKKSMSQAEMIAMVRQDYCTDGRARHRLG